jgi:hypothetical protein
MRGEKQMDDLKVFVVCQKYFDNGSVEVEIKRFDEREVPDNSFLEKYDLYYDVFYTEKDAQEFAEECKTA